MKPLEISFTNHGRRHTWLRWYNPETQSLTAAKNHAVVALLDDYYAARAIEVTPHIEHRPDASGVCSLCGAICEVTA
jgi:hypothetical protein